MAKQCMVTGKKPRTANNVSHSNVKTKRRQLPNLHWKRFWVPSENRWVRLRVTAKGMKTINVRGIEAVLADIRANGTKV